MNKDNKTLKNTVIIEHINLSIDELCHATQVSQTIIIEWINHDILSPEGTNQKEWVFDHDDFKKAQVAARFSKDLEINSPGIYLALDLLDRIDKLQHINNQLQSLQED